MGVHIDRMRIHREIALHLGQLPPALIAVLDMRRDCRCLLLREQLHGEQRQIFRFDMFGRVHARNAFLNVVSALRILVFTVPRGSPVISAISECVSPSKKAISSVFRCSAGSL